MHNGDLAGDGFDGGYGVGDVKRGDAGVLNGLFYRRQHVNLHTDTPAEEHAPASSFCIAAQILSLAGKASIATALPLRMPFASVIPKVSACCQRSRSRSIANTAPTICGRVRT